MIQELTQVRLQLANFETQYSYVLERAEEINKQYQLLQPAYNAVCMERDNLKKEIEQLKKELNTLKENGEHDTNDQKS